MEQFAALLDALVYTSSRNAKLKLLADYLRRTPDPDRGWALAALTDGLDFPAVKSAAIRNMLMERIDPRLIMIAGACVSALALACIGLLHRPSELYAFHILYGFCYGTCGLVPATTIVARWFEARRPLALSIASARHPVYVVAPAAHARGM